MLIKSANLYQTFVGSRQTLDPGCAIFRGEEAPVPSPSHSPLRSSFGEKEEGPISQNVSGKSREMEDHLGSVTDRAKLSPF